MIEILPIFTSLFKARNDVFAIRWEYNGKSGYVPAYNFDRQELNLHKANGGTLQNFKNKTFRLLTDQELLKHLNGKQTVGAYPLLPDNTSWFIAADFDEGSWLKDCTSLLKTCEQYQVPAYLERSRSGKGGHVWLFFESPYPASKSRAIMHWLMVVTGLNIKRSGNSSFDRLFPNQDQHSGKEMGNLIALPLQKSCTEIGNSCFIDIANETPFENQFAFLQSIKKISLEQLDELFTKLDIAPQSPIQEEPLPSNEFQIHLSSEIMLSNEHITNTLHKLLRDELRFINSDYLIRKKMGKNTYAVAPYFNAIEYNRNHVLLPRGFIKKLLTHCISQRIPYKLIDKRKKLTAVSYSSKINLYDFQQAAVNSTDKKEFGVIVAPPGSGKTVIGLSIIANKKQPALIIVHRKQLFDQWRERIQSFLGIPQHQIGTIADGKRTTGLHITVAMIQSLATINATDDIFKSFGIVIIDECHHMPSTTFTNTIKHLNTFYLYGLTATPIRKNNDEKLIFIHIGDIIHEVKLNSDDKDHTRAVSIIIRNSDLCIPFNIKTDNPELLSQVLINDSVRNQLIIDDVKREVVTGKKVLILTERKAHITILHQYLKQHCETITLSGEDKEATKKFKLKQIAEGNYQVLIATGQFIGEGTDIPSLDGLILAYPFAFEGKLIQYIGRVQRKNSNPIIYDYRDSKIEYLDKLFKKRNKYYLKLSAADQLKTAEELTLIFEAKTFFINNPAHPLSISYLELPLAIEQFKKGIAWRIRVLQYSEDTNELMAEILDYSFRHTHTPTNQLNLNLFSIEKITFRSIDTTGLLQSVILKKTTALLERPISGDKASTIKEWTISKSMKVPFNKINFLYGKVSFLIYIQELNSDIPFEIFNSQVRPEFEAIKPYFSKILKKKLIHVELKIRYNEGEILEAIASSADVDKINHTLLETVRFHFIKKHIFTNNNKEINLLSFDQLFNDKDANIYNIFPSETALIDDILNIKNAKHYHQIKYLSALHEASILKIRFVLKPFSFLFLLSGNTKYHIIWETLDSEEATYLWHANKNKEDLRKKLNEIEQVLIAIRDTGKKDYLSKDHSDFSRIVHDYSGSMKAFTTWKSMLEERIV